MSEKGHFNAEKVFALLFVATVVEVVWGMAGADWNKMLLWSGLGICAFYKGWLIAVYFMHLKFEGWVVKSLILPTPLLILVIYGYVSPDVSHGDDVLDHPIGTMYDNETGGFQNLLLRDEKAHSERAEEE